MAVKIHSLTEADVLTKVRLELEAFKSHPRIPMQWPRGYTADLHAFKDSGDRDGLRDPANRFFKAVDAATGQIVGTAEWTLCLDPAAEAAGQPIRNDAHPPANWPEGGNWELRRFYKINFEKMKKETLAGVPFIVLNFLTVLPEAQGRGIGAKLLAWGIEEADRRGAAACLESTPAGLALYKKYGFTETRVIKADMQDFGWTQPYDEEAAKRVFMIREAR